MEIVRQRIRESIEIKRQLLRDDAISRLVAEAADRMIECYERFNGATYFCGNGGSAADAQHLAAELVGRFVLERPGLAAQALTANTSVLTAIANDYDYDRVLARQVEAFVKPHDVLVGLSTSGNSRNVLAAVAKAKEIGAFTVGFTGGAGGRLKALSDCCICIPSSDTARIQECHILLGHILCEVVEAHMAKCSGPEFR